jgi:hypothetical protein
MSRVINNQLLDIVKEHYLKTGNITQSCINACKESGIDYNDSLRRKFSNKLKQLGLTDTDNISETDSNNYSNDRENKSLSEFNAIGPDGKLMPIEKYCEFYGLDFSKIRSYKLISHSGTPFYNVVFFEEEIESLVSIEELKDIIEKGLKSIKYEKVLKQSTGKVGVVKIADLHLGAYVDNLIRTKQFSIDILANKLSDAVIYINDRNYLYDLEMHIHQLEDKLGSLK